jgi:hypothetical protein
MRGTLYVVTYTAKITDIGAKKILMLFMKCHYKNLGFGMQLLRGGQFSPRLFTISSKRYVRCILLTFFSQLTDEKSYGHFMRDNATAHTENNSLVAFHEVFGERIVS